MQNVRNFWIEADIDGAKTMLSGGPRSKDGGFYLTIKQRDNGSVTTPVKIFGKVRDGQIILNVENANTGELFTIKTTR